MAADLGFIGNSFSMKVAALQKASMEPKAQQYHLQLEFNLYSSSGFWQR